MINPPNGSVCLHWCFGSIRISGSHNFKAVLVDLRANFQSISIIFVRFDKMLNNQDFAKLTSQPEAFEKVRFDLKQIEQWDKQNAAKMKKKPSSGKHSLKPSSEENDADEDAADQSIRYRDRANERRKHVVSAEDSHLEKLAETLDAEQTKFLGGDEAHTHLVKGLDYALLRKNREKASSTLKPSSDDTDDQAGINFGTKISSYTNISAVLSQAKSASSSTQAGPTTTKVVANTLMGQNIHKLILQQILTRTLHSMSSNAPTKLSDSILLPTRSMLITKTYEFDLRPDSLIDIPVVVNRSKTVSS